MNENVKIMFGTPMYNNQCYHGFVAGLVSTVEDLINHKIKYDFYFNGNDSLVTRSRNHIVNYFLASDCTHLMFIDADIFFTGDSVRKLLETKKDFICAPYPKKVIDWDRVHDHFWEFISNPNRQEVATFNFSGLGASYVVNYVDNNNIPIPDENNVIEVAHSGTGFMLLSRKVFEDLEPLMVKTRDTDYKDAWYTEFFKTEVDKDGFYLSEDWFFCNKWRELNNKVYLRTDIVLNHIGSHIFEGNLNRIKN